MEKIIVTTFYDQNYLLLAAKTNPNHRAYCGRHGYEYRAKEMTDAFVGSGYEALCRMGFFNVDYAQETLLGMRDGQWLFTLGCDTVITKMDFELEELAKLYVGYEIITGSDWDGINSSQMLIKNTPRVRKYFDEMLSWILGGGEHDQAYLKTHPEEFLVMSAQGWMNAYDHELRLEEFDPKKHWDEGDFLVHLAGSTLEQRMGVIDKWLGRVK